MFYKVREQCCILRLTADVLWTTDYIKRFSEMEIKQLYADSTRLCFL